MAQKTIHQAAEAVLKSHPGEMTLNELLKGIQDSGGYEFKTKDPRGVLSKAIRRRSSDAANDKSGSLPVMFKKTETGKITLA